LMLLKRSQPKPESTYWISLSPMYITFKSSPGLAHCQGPWGPSVSWYLVLSSAQTSECKQGWSFTCITYDLKPPSSYSPVWSLLPHH
jgi:hypothetical protein